jgi:hypothetical protein
LFSDFKNELQRVEENKIEAKKKKNRLPSYMLASILESDKKKPQKRNELPVETILPKYQDILKIFYVPASEKICIVLKKGNMYLLDSTWTDLSMIRINKKLKERSYMSTGKKNLWSLMNMKQRVAENGEPLSTSSLLTTRSG